MTFSKLSNEQSGRVEGSRRTEHAYAIVRVDEFLGADVPMERRITVKKVMRNGEEAEHEVERLNGLQSDSGVRYFSQITRLEVTDHPAVTEEATSQAATPAVSDHISVATEI